LSFGDLSLLKLAFRKKGQAATSVANGKVGSNSVRRTLLQIQPDQALVSQSFFDILKELMVTDAIRAFRKLVFVDFVECVNGIPCNCRIYSCFHSTSDFNLQAG
jgi:hypothetical protein